MLPPLLAPVTAAGALPWSPEADAPARQTCGPGQAVCLLCTAWARAAPSRKHFDQRTSQKSSLNLCSAAHQSHDLGQVACPHEPQVPHL